MLSASQQAGAVITALEKSVSYTALFFKGLLKPNYCSHFDETLHGKITFKDLLKTFCRINLSLLEVE